MSFENTSILRGEESGELRELREWTSAPKIPEGLKEAQRILNLVFKTIEEESPGKAKEKILELLSQGSQTSNLEDREKSILLDQCLLLILWKVESI